MNKILNVHLCTKLGWRGGERDGWRGRPVYSPLSQCQRQSVSRMCMCVRACHLVSTNTKRESGVDVDVKAPEKNTA